MCPWYGSGAKALPEKLSTPRTLAVPPTIDEWPSVAPVLKLILNVSWKMTVPDRSATVPVNVSWPTHEASPVDSFSTHRSLAIDDPLNVPLKVESAVRSTTATSPLERTGVTVTLIVVVVPLASICSAAEAEGTSAVEAIATRSSSRARPTFISITFPVMRVIL